MRNKGKSNYRLQLHKFSMVASFLFTLVNFALFTRVLSFHSRFVLHNLFLVFAQTSCILTLSESSPFIQSPLQLLQPTCLDTIDNDSDQPSLYSPFSIS
jgi:hypothetical protein